MRGDFGFRDRGRHGPGRVEIDAGNLGGQRRRRFFGLADDDAIAPHHLVVFDRFGVGGGKVDHDVALAELEVHVGEAFERGFQLLQALVHGDIERGQRPRRHGAGGGKAVARLESFYRFRERVVVGACGFVAGKVLGDDQALAQQVVMRALYAGREFSLGRNHRPAAAHRDVGIAQRGFLDPLRGAFVEGRLMRQRQCCGRALLRRRSCCGRFCRRGVRCRMRRFPSGPPLPRALAQAALAEPWKNRGRFQAGWRRRQV